MMTQTRDLTWDYVCDIEREHEELLITLRRIAAGDPTHSSFAILAINEARAAIAKAESRPRDCRGSRN